MVFKEKSAGNSGTRGIYDCDGAHR
jgi:hypothetical protein